MRIPTATFGMTKATRLTPVKILASTMLVVALASGCGGDGRPTVDEISEALQSEDNVLGSGLEKKQADCIAEAFHDSDVSDDALRAIVDNDEDYEGSDDDQKALTDISTDSMASCMKE